jgi:hypothetical protein
MWDRLPAGQLNRQDAGSTQGFVGVPETGFHVAAYAGSAGLGALAVLGEEPPAADWVRLARDRLREWLLDRSGCGSNETISSMAWASQTWSFLDALYRITGDDLFENVAVGCDTLLDIVAWRELAWREGGAVKSSRLMLGGEQAPAFPLLYAAFLARATSVSWSGLTNRSRPASRKLSCLCAFFPTSAKLSCVADGGRTRRRRRSHFDETGATRT